LGDAEPALAAAPPAAPFGKGPGAPSDAARLHAAKASGATMNEIWITRRKVMSLRPIKLAPQVGSAHARYQGAHVFVSDRISGGRAAR
jgi:hypothetical protein